MTLNKSNMLKTILILWFVGFISILIAFTGSIMFGYRDGLISGGFLLVSYVITFLIFIEIVKLVKRKEK